MRLFAALSIEADEEFLKLLHFLTHNLRDDRIKWVDPNNLHLTLKFFGNIPAKNVEMIDDVIRPIAARTAAFEMEVSGLGQFGSQYSPKVIWMAIKQSEMVSELGEALLDALHEKGFERDRQNFVPHISLGRINQIKSKTFYQKVIERVKDIHLPPQLITKIHLYKSELTPDGPVYEKISTYPLGTSIGLKPLGKPVIA